MTDSEQVTGQHANHTAPAPGDEIVGRRMDRTELWGRVVLTHLLWIGIGVGALVLQYARAFHGLYLFDAMDVAQLGRHLAAGDGFVTSFVRPLALAVSGHAPGPELFQQPLYPFVLALAFGVFGQSDTVVAGVSAFFVLASLPLIYLLGLKMFNRRVGILAAILYALNATTMEYALSGVWVTMSAFLFTLVVYLLYVNAGATRRTFAAGAVMGLCWLTSYMAAALMVPALIAAYCLQSQRRRAHLLWFVIGLVVVMAPWWVRTYRVTGDPFLSLRAHSLVMSTDAYPGSTLVRSTDPSSLHLATLAGDNVKSVVKKVLLGAAAEYQAVPALVGICVIALLVLAALRSLPTPKLNTARKLAFVFIGFAALGGALCNAIPETFFALVPFVVILGAGYFMSAAEDWIGANWRMTLAAVLLVALAAYPLLVSWAVPTSRPPVNRSNLERLRRELPAKAVVVTDAPSAVTWYADRIAVWLPLRVSDFQRVQRKIGVDAIYFSTLLRTYPASEQAWGWQQVYAQGATPPGFEPAAELPGGEMLIKRSVGRR